MFRWVLDSTLRCENRDLDQQFLLNRPGSIHWQIKCLILIPQIWFFYDKTLYFMKSAPSFALHVFFFIPLPSLSSGILAAFNAWVGRSFGSSLNADGDAGEVFSDSWHEQLVWKFKCLDGYYLIIYPYYRHCLGILKELWIGYDRILVLCNGQMIVLDERYFFYIITYYFI